MNDAYDVRITAEASADLLAIHTYIRKHSEQNAAEMIERLLSAIDALDRLPHRYNMHRRSDKPDQIIRSMPVSPFVVYYRVLEDDRVVRILTVRHDARRKPRRFRR